MLRKRLSMPNYKKRIISYILLPVLLAVILLAMLNYYMLKNISRQLLNQCSLSHSNFVSHYEQEFCELSQNSILLMENDNFKSIYYDFIPIPSQMNYKFTDVVHTLSSYASTKNYILQVGFINQINKRYISSAGTAFLSQYYDNSAYGTVVNARDYLNSYKKRASVFQIQRLDTKYKQTVIPLLQYQLGQNTVSSPLITYISKAYFSNDLRNYKGTEHSQLFIYCKETGQIIASNQTKTDETIQNMLSASFHYDPASKKVTLNGTQYYAIVTASKTNYCDPLLFISLIPWNEIQNQTASSWILFLVVLMICTIMAALMILLFSTRLYSPIKGLVNRVSSCQESENDPKLMKDELSYIDHHIMDLLHSNHDLLNTMNTALPTIYNRYILNILYQESYENQQLEPILKNYSFHFPFARFTCSILVPIFLPEFFDHFTKAEQAIIKHQLADMLELTLATFCVKYVFRMEEDHFCIISNSADENHARLLCDDFNYLQKLFAFDREANYIQLYVAIGSTYEGLESLHRSWKEANLALSKISFFQNEHLSIYKEASDPISTYRCDAADDNRILAYLYQGNAEALNELTGDIIADNLQQPINEDSLKGLYLHLYELGDSILRKLDLNGMDLLQEEYIDLNAFINKLSNFDRSIYLRKFYETLCQRQSSENTSGFDLTAMKEYIDSHYSENLYLDSLAEMYHTSSKYISRVLKQALGTPFKQYITTLRISKAKTLLSDTDQKIDDISLKVGFNNRTSFIRTFKQLEGMTPGEYREYSRQ